MEIMELIKQLSTVIITPLLVLIITKRFDIKIDKRFEGIEADIKQIKHELDVDKDIESYIRNMYQYYGYYYEIYKKHENIKIVDAICSNILYNIFIIFNLEFDKKNVNDIKLILENNINYFNMINSSFDHIVINEIILFLKCYNSKIIDIVLDIYNKKSLRIVRETNELIKAIFLTLYSEEK